MFAAALALSAVLLDPSTPLQRQLRGGERHEYSLQLRAGAFARVVVEQEGIDVVVSAFAPDGKALGEVDSPNGARGPEPLAVPAAAAGAHRIVVRSFDADAAPGAYTIRVDELLSRKQYRARRDEEQRRDAAVIQWMKSRATSVGELRTVLDGVCVVALGEATHGSQEIFSTKRNLITALVRDLKYRLVAIEGTAAGGEAIDEYVLGRGDRASVIAALKSNWITSTEELLATIEWMRTFNEWLAKYSAPDDRVRFVGLDPQGNAPALDHLAAFLRRVAPETADGAQPLLDFLRAEDVKANRFERTSVPAEQVEEIRRLIAFLVVNEGLFVRRTSADDYARALRGARILAQAAEFNSGIANAITRDAAMAENFFRAVGKRKAVIWTHNAHASANDRGAYKPLGALLRAAYGSGYFAFATAFGRGSFRAQVPRPVPPDLRTFTVPSAPAGTIDAMIAASGATMIDLRHGAAPEPRVAAWLAAPQRMHWIGALYDDSWTEAQRFQPFVLSSDFDGIIFLPSTTAARPLP